MVPLELLEKLGPMASQLGISLPNEVRFAAQVDASMPMRALALELGRLAAGQDLFVKAGELVTVDAATGEERPMTPKRFVGWIEEFCQVRGVRQASLSREQATLVLAQDIFIGCLRPLDGVHLMRLPVRRADGRVEFLAPGYDVASRIYTVAQLDYEMDWPVERGLSFLREWNEEWPWAWPDERRPEELGLNRNYAVHMAACLGTYCKAMFPPGTKRPMITYIANQVGSGKSTLVAMVLLPVHGSAATSKTARDDDRMSAELETVAQSMKPYLFFDDIAGGLFSAPLNRFITSSSHTGRIYGQNREVFLVPNVTQVFSTGNEIKTTPDLVRRSLVAELFVAGDIAGRTFKRRITEEELARPEVRCGFLSAYCSLVRYWVENGQPMYDAPLASFEQWSATIVGMMSLHAFENPLIPPALSSGGAEDENEMRDLLVAVATEALTDGVYDRKQLVAKARERGLLENLVGTEGEGDIDSASSKKFGRQLQHWRGRELRDQKGRLFRFAHRHQNRGAAYPLSFITPSA